MIIIPLRKRGCCSPVVAVAGDGGPVRLSRRGRAPGGGEETSHTAGVPGCRRDPAKKPDRRALSRPLLGGDRRADRAPTFTGPGRVAHPPGVVQRRSPVFPRPGEFPGGAWPFPGGRGVADGSPQPQTEGPGKWRRRFPLASSRSGRSKAIGLLPHVAPTETGQRWWRGIESPALLGRYGGQTCLDAKRTRKKRQDVAGKPFEPRCVAPGQG